MMIKKALCFIIAVVMIVCTAAYADTADALTADALPESFALLSELGFIPESIEQNYNGDKKVTRGDFASLMSLSMGLSGIGLDADAGKFFTDVLQSNENYKDIGLCASVNLISGDGMGKFNPEKRISFSEAVKIVMSALGYDELAKAYGGYPTGYLKCASDNKVTSGISGQNSSSITWDTALALIANAIDTKMFMQTGFGDNITYDSASGKTWINHYHKLTKYEGTVTGTADAVFDDIDALDENEIRIDDAVYECRKNHADLLGRKVYFYTDDDAKVAAAVCVADSSETVTVIEWDKILSFSDNVLTYEKDGDKTVSMHISSVTDVIYNGKPATLSDSEWHITGGNIRIVSEGNKAKNAVISEPKTFAIKKAFDNSETFYDMYGNGMFSAKDKDVTFVDSYGNNMEFTELNAYDVISVFESKDQSFARLYYSNSEIDGKIEGIQKSGSAINITLSGVTFPVAYNFLKEADKLSVGQEGLFGLTIYGEIATMKPLNISETWAYLADCAQGSGLDATVRLKLFCEDDKMYVYELCDRVMIDGRAVKKEDVLSSLPYHNGVVRYGTYSGRISRIDTLQKGEYEDENSANILFEGYDDNKKPETNLIYNVRQNIFGMKVPANSNTRLFIVPADSDADDTMYRAKTLGYFTHDKTYVFNAYRVGENAHTAEVLVIYTGSADSYITKDTPVTVVESVSRKIASDGEYCYVVNGYTNGQKVAKEVHSDEVIDNLCSIFPGQTDQKHTLSTGDVVKLGTDADTDKVMEIALYYEQKNDYLLTNAVVGKDIISNRMLRANVYSEDGGNLWLTQDELASDNIKLSVDYIESINASLYKIYRLYRHTNGELKLETASVRDIADYKSSGENFSKILMFSAYNEPGTILIYR
ncbi:MAG: hypothetical protein J6B23_10055 [Clostridia bacterium]|nr:hypothetical protein [Clostridia bacterium]